MQKIKCAKITKYCKMCKNIATWLVRIDSNSEYNIPICSVHCGNLDKIPIEK